MQDCRPQIAQVEYQGQTRYSRILECKPLTDLAANFGCNRLRIMPDIDSKLLHAAIWSRCAVQFESEQTPFSRIRRRYRSAALHRIRLGTCGFVPMSCLYSGINEWSKDWAERWARLWLATTFRQFHRKFHFTLKKSDSSRPEIYKSLNSFWLSNWVSITRVVARFPQASRWRPTAIAADSEKPCVCARPSDQSDPPKLLEGGSKSSALDFVVKIFDCLLE